MTAGKTSSLLLCLTLLGSVALATWWLVPGPVRDWLPIGAGKGMALEDDRASSPRDDDWRVHPPDAANPPTKDELVPDARRLVQRSDPDIEILVTSPSLQAIDGARVCIESAGTSRRGRTDSEGRLGLCVPRTGSMPISVLVEAEGFHHSRSEQASSKQIHIVLHPLTRVCGTVIDESTKAPIAGATVTYDHPACEGCEGDPTMTDSLGRFSLDQVASGLDARIHVSADDYATNVFHVQTRADVPRSRHDLVMRRGERIWGIVVDHTTGKGIADVEIEDRGVTWTSPGKTDDCGRFDFRILRSEVTGRMTLSLEKDDYCRMQRSVAPGDMSQVQGMHVRMVRAARIEGTVRDARGDPIAGAVVHIIDGNSRRFRQSPARTPAGVDTRADPLADLGRTWQISSNLANTTVETDREGRFGSTGFVPWSQCTGLRVVHPGHLESNTKVPRLPGCGGTRRLDLRLEDEGPVGQIHGRLSFNGKQCSAHVTWKGRTRSGSLFIDGEPDYCIEVEAGRVEVSLQPLESTGVFSRACSGTGRSVFVPEGRSTRVDWILASKAAEIRGRLTRADGSPLGGEWVTATSQARGRSYRGQTAKDGTWSIEVPIDQGPFHLSIVIGTEVFSREDVLPGQSGIDFVAPLIGHVLVKIVDDETGAAPEASGLRIWCRKDGEQEWRMLRSSSSDLRPGAWSELASTSGVYDLRVSDSQDSPYAPWTRSGVCFAPREPLVRQVIRLRKGAVLVVHPAEDQPSIPEGTRILLIEPEMDQQMKVSVVDGRMRLVGAPTFPIHKRSIICRGRVGRRIEGLLPGRYLLRSYGSRMALTPSEVLLREGEERQITLSLTIRSDRTSPEVLPRSPGKDHR